MAPLALGPTISFHVHVRRFQEGTLVAHRQHGQRVGLTHGGHAGTLNGIDRDIHRVAVSGTNLLADIEHRSFINFTFADNNLTINLNLVENVAHGRYGRTISDILVTTSEPLVASQCSRFRHSGKLDRQFTSHRISNLWSSKTGGILPQGQTFAHKSSRCEQECSQFIQLQPNCHRLFTQLSPRCHPRCLAWPRLQNKSLQHKGLR